MEQETIVKEIINALKIHSGHIDKKFEEMDRRFEEMNTKMDRRFEEMNTKMDNMRSDLESRMDKGFDQLGKKVDGIRVELTETQETTNYVLSKIVQHEKKLRQLSQQQQ